MLRLPDPLQERIGVWARARYPQEACGLLIGRCDGASIEVVHVREARNLDTARAGERFELDPAAHLAAEEFARENGLDVIGVWHSHPDRPALPSAADRAQAWSRWSYVIVPVTASATGQPRSWRLEGERLVEEEVRP